MSQAIYRTYRPQTFADISGQEHVVVTVQNQIRTDKVSHAYLFTGPRGVGKTTIARLIAKAINCEKKKDSEPCNECTACVEITKGSALDICEIDAASHTDVENVRENIIKSVRFAPNGLKFKVYIIDEVHMLSTSAFNALLKTLEEPPAHAIFILATTEIHKVPQTIISRCQRFDFRRIPIKAIVKRIKGIAEKEGVEIEDDVLGEIARHADGCARDAESLLGQVFALGEKKITMNEATLVLPATTHVLVLDFIEKLITHDGKAAIDLLNTYIEQGIDLRHFTEDSIELLRTVLLGTIGDKDQVTEAFDETTQKRLITFISQTNGEAIALFIDHFLEARRLMKVSHIPQLPIELAILKGCQWGGGQAPLEIVEDGPKNDQGPSDSAPPEPPVVTESSVSETKEVEAPIASSTPELVKEEVVEVLEVLEEKDGEVSVEKRLVKLDEAKRKWPEVYKQLKECHASLPFIMESAAVSSIEGNEIEISFGYSFYAETMNQEKNRCLIEKIAEKVFGTPMRIRAKYTMAEADSAAAELIGEFGGSVV